MTRPASTARTALSCPGTVAAYAGVRAQRVRASCGKGEEQYCLKGNTFTYGSADRDGSPTHSGYSSHIVVTRTSS
jgi:D-arabinose 1-dehydrogenase-like Zn-dependent alcohol dehydrogenase